MCPTCLMAETDTPHETLLLDLIAAGAATGDTVQETIQLGVRRRPRDRTRLSIWWNDLME